MPIFPLNVFSVTLLVINPSYLLTIYGEIRPRQIGIALPWKSKLIYIFQVVTRKLTQSFCIGTLFVMLIAGDIKNRNQIS
jgi:hypothetical protein